MILIAPSPVICPNCSHGIDDDDDDEDGSDVMGRGKEIDESCPWGRMTSGEE